MKRRNVGVRRRRSVLLLLEVETDTFWHCTRAAILFLLEGLSGSSGLIERCRLELVLLPRTSQPLATQAWRHVLFLFPFLHLIRATLDGNSSHSLLCYTQQILPCQSTLRRLDHVILLLTFHHHIFIPYPHHIHAVALYSCLEQFLVLQSRLCLKYIMYPFEQIVLVRLNIYISTVVLMYFIPSYYPFIDHELGLKARKSISSFNS